MPGLPAGSRLQSVASLSLRDGELLALLTLRPIAGVPPEFCLISPGRFGSGEARIGHSVPYVLGRFPRAGFRRLRRVPFGGRRFLVPPGNPVKRSVEKIGRVRRR